jgi:ketosteroid isomerase-like protein
MPGAFHLRGKAAFAKDMQNDAFVANPIINPSRMIEGKNVVVAEGNVRSARKAGGFLNTVFCDVFEMQNGRIKRLTSYVMEIKE